MVIAAESLSAYELFRFEMHRAADRIRGRWRLVVITALATWVLSVLAALLWPKTYRAETILVPASTEDAGGPLAGLASQFSGLASLAGINLGGESTEAEALALLQSRGFIESFIEDEQLLPVLFADDWDPLKGEWRTKDPDDVPSLWKGYDRFRKRILRVKQNQLTRVVTVSVDWRDPVLASEWANKLIRRLNQAMRQRAIAEARKSLRFLDNELKATNVVALQEAISRLMEVQMRAIMYASVREEYSFSVVDEAKPPDPKDFRWPNRPLLIGGGLFLGCLLGAAVGVLLPARSPRLQQQ